MEMERTLFWRVVQNRPQRAVRSGKWKLVFDGRPLLSRRRQLLHLTKPHLKAILLALVGVGAVFLIRPDHQRRIRRRGSDDGPVAPAGFA